MNWNPGFFLESEMFFPIEALCRKISSEKWPDAAAMSRLLTPSPVFNGNGLPIRFVEDCGSDLGYEPRIYLRGEVETRSRSWHDFFNALVWMTFPKSKSRLNGIHFDEMARQPDKRRSRRRDIATLFDESGIIVASSNASLSGMLESFEWKRLFWENREKVSREMRFFIFGHGLYEKALFPYPGLTGHGMVFPVDRAFFEWPVEKQTSMLDDAFGDRYSAIWTTLDFSPVPLLGFPGWSKENGAEAYYNDTNYFRNGRLRKN